MHFCRICRTEKNLKYTLKELRKLGRKRSDERQLLGSTPTLGNICHDCEERLHNFHRLDENEEGDDHEERIIVDDDELLYNLFFEKVGRIMGNGGEWHRQPLRQQTLVATTAAVAVNTDEVIEVLTSRENTPSPAPKAWPPTSINTAVAATEKTTASEPTANPGSDIKLSPANYKVVAVIDLEADDMAAMCVPHESDEEEIVFRSVEPEAVKPSKNKIISPRHSSVNREMRLIASLSLLSSDESDTDAAIENSSIKKLPIAESLKGDVTSAINENSDKPSISPLKCKSCGLFMQTMEELKVHECLKGGVKCPVCEGDFAASQRLIHHMRRKHRSYDGNVLSERPRCAQDSAMTIRLRYLQRYTYYECQLCGRIDAVFKEHKQHVMQQHAAESKSLKDPMMQELKCPVCKEKCGSQYVLLCRHLLTTHTIIEYRAHMREVTHLRNAFNFSVSKQKELRRSARVFQFTKWKRLFFECRHCQKVVTGYFNHLKHWSTHISESVKPTADGTEQGSGRKAKPNIIAERAEKDKDVRVRETSTTKKFSQTKHLQRQKNSQASRHKERKLSKRAVQAALVKVKVKPPLRQLTTQKYKCQWCAEVLLGFHQLNLHLLSMHRNVEQRFYCAACTQSFDSAEKLLKHSKVHPSKQKRKISNGKGTEALHYTAISANGDLKRRRFSPQLSQSKSHYSDAEENKTNDAGEKQKTESTTLLHELNLRILNKKQQQDLYTNNTANNIALTQPLPLQQNVIVEDRNEIKNKQELMDMFSRTHQCQYCTHLFVTAAELRTHENRHMELQEAKLIKRYPIKVASSMANAKTSVHAAP